MAKAPTAVKTASVLAFERKLATTDAVMYSGSWQGETWQPIRIQEKAVRGRTRLLTIRQNWMPRSRKLTSSGWMWLRCPQTPTPYR